ncbi:MAG: hypothetical protein VW683_02700 [Betaproteobacteria bacterium]
MKITRLKSGYKIYVTNHEMELLIDQVNEGSSLTDQQYESTEGWSYSTSAKRIWTEVSNGKREWMMLPEKSWQ